MITTDNTNTEAVLALIQEGQQILADKEAEQNRADLGLQEWNHAESLRRWRAMRQWFLDNVPCEAALWPLSNAGHQGVMPDGFCLRDTYPFNMRNDYVLSITAPGCVDVHVKLSFTGKEAEEKWYQQGKWYVYANELKHDEDGNARVGVDYRTSTSTPSLPEALALAQREYERRNTLLAEAEKKNAERQQRLAQRAAQPKPPTTEEALLRALRAYVRDLLPDDTAESR